MSRTEAIAVSDDVEVRILPRNRLVLRRMRELGIPSISALCHRMGRPGAASAAGELLAMKVAARRSNGRWRQIALDVSEALGSLPEDLFTERQQWGRIDVEALQQSLVAFETERLEEAKQQSPDESLEAAEMSRVLERAMQGLTSKQRQVLRMRFGMDGPEMTLEEIGREFGVVRERIRHIEGKALRRLKHPAFSRELRSLLS